MYTKTPDFPYIEKEVVRWDNGNIRMERYLKNIESPKKTELTEFHYRYGGTIWKEVHLIGEDFHKIDGPAYILYREDGSKSSEAYYVKRERHREDGPAVLWYDKERNVDMLQFWVGNTPIRFWKLYDRSVEAVQKTLLKEWLHHV
jgi:hypothetical protein